MGFIFDSSGFSLILMLAFMIILGHGFGRLAEKMKLPEVTGFIISGILLNLFFSKILNYEHEFHTLVESMSPVTVIALSFIAYSLGAELWIPKIKKNYKTILVVVLMQIVLVIGFTTLLFIVFKQPLWLGLLLGGVSAATAPAPIIEITKKYKAKGELTNHLKPIVGFDNIFGITAFAIVLVVSQALKKQTSVDFSDLLLSLSEVGLSLLIGIVAGIILVVIDHFFLCRYCNEEKYESYLVTVVGLVLLVSVGTQMAYIHSGLLLTPFISTLVVGFVYTNFISKETYDYESSVINHFTPPLITAFFVIAGAELDITALFSTVGLLAILYVIGHATGKFLGAYIGARVTNAPKVVKKHLPYAGLTQGGFEIIFASSMSLFDVFQEDAKMIKTIVLMSVLMFEFFAPLLVTKALFNAGEARAHEVVCEI